jgi:2'-phosphotransferase
MASAPCQLTPSESREARRLIHLLRHDKRVSRDEAGYVAMDVLQMRFGLRLSEARMLDVAALDEKSRFGVKKECRSFIRANQGHSVEGLCDDALLTRVTEDDLPPLGSPPCVCVHGTSAAAWALIRTSGLRRMNRQHVHFATGLPGASGVISGMRAKSEVLIFLDVRRALTAGISLFRSDNGVLLSPGLDGLIPTSLFERVVDARSGAQLLWAHKDAEDGTNQGH